MPDLPAIFILWCIEFLRTFPVHSTLPVSKSDLTFCLAIGVFDGVHIGHQKIIRQMVAEARSTGAKSLVVTFDRHPCAVVAPDKVPMQIYSRSQKARAIESLGVDFLLEIPFDRAFSEKSGEEFIHELARVLGDIRGIHVGEDFTFGYRKSGNVELLRKLGNEMHFQAHGHSKVMMDGQVVSSTRIREVIRLGRIDEANRLLGRPPVSSRENAREHLLQAI